MNSLDSFERSVTTWLDEAAGSPRFADLETILERTATTRQRSAWVFPERWIPVEISMRRLELPRPVVVGLAVLALVLALIGSAIWIGSHLPRRPSLVGPAANGLLVVDDSSYHVSTMRADGTGRTVISLASEVAADPIWSPDGTHIAYYSWPVRTDALPDFPAPLVNSPDKPIGSVVVVAADGSGRTVVAEHRQFNMTGVLPLTWSHDGTRLAYAFLDSGLPTIDIVAADGRNHVTIEGGETPTWSPDDKTIAFRRNLVGVFLIPSDGTGSERALTSVGGSGFAFALPQWSPDGNRIAFYGGEDGGHDVYITDLAGNATAIPSNTSADEYWPIWSPDGTKLAFERVINGNNEINFVVADADGSNGRMLETVPIGGWLGTWSPDGRYLVGHVSNAAGTGFGTLIFVDVADPTKTLTLASDGAIMDWQRLAP